MGSTQYNEIISDYNKIYDDRSDSPFAQLEEANLEAALKEYIPNARVLELACGSGVYSRKMLQWGAQSVMGVDISTAMVDDAKARARSLRIGEDQLDHCVADVSNGLDLSDRGGPWDLVVGTWLLNYASSAKDMQGMWKTVYNNLRPGGCFLGLTIPPPLAGRDELERALNAEWALYGTSGRVKEAVEDGFSMVTMLGMPGTGKKVEFDNFYLRTEAYESSTKAVGLGALEWLPFVLPEKTREAHPRGYWNKAVLNPHFRICQVKR